MKDIVAFSSVLVILITFALGYIERRSSNRRQRTMDFLMGVIEGDGPIHDAHLELAMWTKGQRAFENDEVNTDEERIIIKLLDYYDLVADTAMRGVIDKEMIAVHLGGRMRATYSVLANYINHRRKRLNRQGLYLPFETFVNKYISVRNV